MSKLWAKYQFSRCSEERMNIIIRGVEENTNLRYHETMNTEFTLEYPKFACMNRYDLHHLEMIRKYQIDTNEILKKDGIDGLRFSAPTWLGASALGMIDVALLNEQFWHLQYLLCIPVFTNHWETRWRAFWTIRCTIFAIFFFLRSAFGLFM